MSAADDWGPKSEYQQPYPQQPQQPQPEYTPEPAYPHRPHAEELVKHSYPQHEKNMFAGLVSDKLLPLFIIAGLLVMFLGAMICNSSMVTNPNADDYDRANALQGYKAGAVIYNLGIFILSTFLLLAAFLRHDYNTYVRLGIFIAVGFILGLGGFNLWGYSTSEANWTVQF